jgi:hypothetical protein
MIDHNTNNEAERITQLERAQAAQTAELAALREQMSHEKAERQALERLLLPTVTETRKDLELHVSFLTDRLEALKARAAGEPGGISTDAAMEAFDAVADGLRSLVSFAATTVESLRIVFEADAAKDVRDAAALDERLKTSDAMDLFRALDERLRDIERLLLPVLEGRARLTAIAA